MYLHKYNTFLFFIYFTFNIKIKYVLHKLCYMLMICKRLYYININDTFIVYFFKMCIINSKNAWLPMRFKDSFTYRYALKITLYFRVFNYILFGCVVNIDFCLSLQVLITLAKKNISCRLFTIICFINLI